jgi:hypothetical protein
MQLATNTNLLHHIASFLKKSIRLFVNICPGNYEKAVEFLDNSVKKMKIYSPDDPNMGVPLSLIAQRGKI